MVYLDHNATTPLLPEAREAMLSLLATEFGNPSSIHAAGRRARAVVDDARDDLAALLGAKAHEIIFTGGGTEACNLAVIGLARAHAPFGKHLITSAVEHHAVLHAMEHLAHFEGFDVTVLPVDREGRVDPDRLAAAIRPDTRLVSIMHANNETGTIQPVADIATVCSGRGVLFHTDAVQTYGKLSVRPHDLGVSALSIAAHKFYGPKGVGALWLGAGIALSKITYGGAHENTRRPGTENVAAIAGLAAAARVACGKAEAESARLLPLREELWESIRSFAPHAVRNTPAEGALANTLNVSIPGADGEALLIGLDLEGVAASSGSACMVGSIQASHVLLAMGLPEANARAAVRFSMGTSTSREDVVAAAAALRKVLGHQSAR